MARPIPNDMDESVASAATAATATTPSPPATPPAPATPSWLSRAPGALLAAAVTGTLAFTLATVSSAYLWLPDTHGAVWWPSAGLLMTVLALTPRRHWPPAAVAAAVGNAAGNLLHHQSWPVAAGFGVANALEALIAAQALCPVHTRALVAGELTGAWRVAALRVVRGLVTAVGVGGAVVGVCTAFAEPSLSVPVVQGYVCAHLLGMLLLAPLAPRLRAGRSELGAAVLDLEWLAMLTVETLLSLYLFCTDTRAAVWFVVVVPLAVAVFRLGLVRSTVITVVVAVISAVGTAAGHGAFAVIADPTHRLEALQGMLAVCCLLSYSSALARQGRHAADARIRDSERVLALSLEAAPAGIFVASLEPGRVGELLQVNSALCTMLRRPADALIGLHASILGAPEDARLAQAHLDRMAAGTLKSYARPRALLRSDGERVLCNQTISVVDPERGVPYFVAHVEDLTALKQSERAMLDALEAQRAATRLVAEAAEAQADAMSKLAHDLRTPLTSVRGYTELLRDSAEGVRPADELAMFDVVEHNLERLTGLIDQLMSSRRDALTPVPLPMLPTRLDEVARVAVDTVAPLSRRVGLRLMTSGLDEPVWVAADRDQLERAVVNLLSNAIKYTPAGGTVTAALAVEGIAATLAVTDTGIGVAPEDLRHLGSRYFRAGSATDNGIPGSGLGLAITKTVAANCGGFLTAQSRLGHGSTFALVLPTVEPAMGAPDDTVGPTGRPGGQPVRQSVAQPLDQPVTSTPRQNAMRSVISAAASLGSG